MSNNKVNSQDLKWVKLPDKEGYYWYRVTLRHGIVYRKDIRPVKALWGKICYVDEYTNPTVPVVEDEMIDWFGPLIPPK